MFSRWVATCAVAVSLSGSVACSSGDDAATRVDAGHDASGGRTADARAHADATHDAPPQDARADRVVAVDGGGTIEVGAPLDAAPGLDAPADATFDVTDGSPVDTGVWTPPAFWPVDASLPIDGAPTTNHPAFHPNAPQIANNGGRVLTAPVFVPIVYASDPYLPQIEAFVSAMGPSQYWHAVTSEYGVGAGAPLPLVVLSEPAPALVTDSLEPVDGGTVLTSWLANELATDPRFGAMHAADAGLPDGAILDAGPDALGGTAEPPTQAVYLLFYPLETQIVTPFGPSCLGFGGYHAYVTLRDGSVAIYAVIARCPATDWTGAAAWSITASHEMVEAVTDPILSSGYAGLDMQHYGQPVPGMNAAFNVELGDMCESVSPTAYINPTDPALSAFLVQRTWSNAAIVAGHDPCVPALAGEVFYNAVPITPDAIAVPGLGNEDLGDSMPGVRLPVGGQVTFDLALYSDGDTGGPWSVQLQAVYAENLMQAGLGATLSQSSGQNGDLIQVSLYSLAGFAAGPSSLVVSSATPAAMAAGYANEWYFDVLTY